METSPLKKKVIFKCFMLKLKSTKDKEEEQESHSASGIQKL